MSKDEWKILIKNRWKYMSDMENLIDGLIELIGEEKQNYLLGEKPHPAVISCLDAAQEHLSNAAVAYYASTK